jgi:biopolymer transport protein ExbD
MSEPAEVVDNEAIASDDELFMMRKRRHASGELIAGLNLTAMMDVLTILLVYLIKVYAEAPESITLNDDLRPPVSTAPSNIVPSVNILISETAIVVDNKPVLEVSKGQVVSKESGSAYAPLSEALGKRVETIKAIAARGGSAFDGNLMIVADEDTPYDLISNVLNQAGRAEFTTFRLVVRKK